ncbi:MAG: acyltransferase family protein [Panacagrimonas sp.]
MKQRHDIDGLRALAVLPVVAFHGGIDQAPGGFVGVDVFFVISGYLIGAIILGAVQRGTFSYLGFYERRIRRIAPALLGMIAATVVAGYFVLLPGEYRGLSVSALAALASVSNFYFWATTDYFAPGTEEPLLHTWSLAVEEQFYILLPPLLVLVTRYFPLRVKAVVVATIVASFVISVILVEGSPTAAFYSPFSRTWELMLGVLLAMGLPLSGNQKSREAAAVLGAILIVLSVLFMTKSTPFPGVAALAPALGAALIIWAGESGTTRVGRVLSMRPMVWIGLISYSLYLWHWPVLFFVRMTGLPFAEGERAVVNLTAIALSFPVAWLSWRYIEQPFRVGQSSLDRKAVFRLAAVGGAGFLMILSALVALDGLPGRFSGEALRLASFGENRGGDRQAQRLNKCFVRDSETGGRDTVDLDFCLARKPDRKNYVLIGDSHGSAIRSGLAAQNPEAHLMMLGATGCRPTMVHSRDDSPRCTRIMDSIFAALLGPAEFDAVIIAGRWRPIDLPRVRQVIETLRERGHRVIVLGPIVEYDTGLPRLLALAVEYDRKDLPAQHLKRKLWKLDADLAKVVRDSGAEYASLIGLICPDQCTTYAPDGTPLQFDYGHLAKAGSSYVAQRMRETLQLPAPPSKPAAVLAP